MDTKFKIVESEWLNSDTFLLTIESDRIAKKSRPGQMVHIKCGEGTEAYLRRPISICLVDREKGTFNLGIQVRGKGTKILSRLKQGDETLKWDKRGYYEVALDEGTLTLTP